MTADKAQQPEYQCSFCTRNLFNGDKSCPLKLCGYENEDMRKGMNRVIYECGCGSFNDARSRPHTPAPDNEKLIKVAKLRIRQLFLDDSKCELCEKVTEEDGYDGQNEGCEKGLCIECAIHKALVEFFDAIALAATLAAEQTDNILSVLKKRYKNEMAILDYVEMIECEVMALAKQADEQDFHPAQNDTKHHNKGQPVGNWQEQHP